MKILFFVLSWIILDNTAHSIIGMYSSHDECQYRAYKYGHLMKHVVQCIPYQHGDKLGPLNVK